MSRSLLKFCEHNGLSQLVTKPTQHDVILDVIIAEFEGHVLHRWQLGTSDHVSLIIHLMLKLKIIAPPPFQKIFHWSSTPWSRIHLYFKCYCWNPYVLCLWMMLLLLLYKPLLVLSSIIFLLLCLVSNHQTYQVKMQAWESGDQNCYQSVRHINLLLHNSMACYSMCAT